MKNTYLLRFSADNGDKALYKAVTGDISSSWPNFNVAEDNDPESDEAEAPKVSNIPPTPEKREEIKQELIDKDGKATKMQINSLKKALKMLRADPEQETFIAAVAEKTEGFTNITKKACEQLILKVGQMIEASNQKTS